MFKKNTPAPSTFEKIDTLIGKNTKFVGTLNAQGTLRIDGSLEGDIVANGDILIGDSGVVKGNINAVNIFICGNVEGNIGATGQLRLSESSKLYGDVEVATFVIDEGAVFEGKTKMGSLKKQEEPVVSKAKPEK